MCRVVAKVIFWTLPSVLCLAGVMSLVAERASQQGRPPLVSTSSKAPRGISEANWKQSISIPQAREAKLACRGSLGIVGEPSPLQQEALVVCVRDRRGIGPEFDRRAAEEEALGRPLVSTNAPAPARDLDYERATPEKQRHLRETAQALHDAVEYLKRHPELLQHGQ